MKKLLILASIFAVLATACNTKNAKEEDRENAEEFAQSQPLESGTYEASYYDVTGLNERKGHFDGRLLAAFTSEVSVLYVYENGNHAKIDYLINLEKPFEKGDSGIYRTVDKEGLPVVLKEDSVYTLTFDKKDSKITIQFDGKPKSTQPAMDVLEKINQLVHK